MDVLEWYRILEIRPGASADDIKEAYLDLVKIWHPDRLQDEHPRLRQKAEEKLKQLNLAYGHLLDHIAASAVELPAAATPSEPDAEPAASQTPERIRPRYFGGMWGYVDVKGRIIIAPRFLFAEPFRSGLACVKAGTRRYGYISPEGEFAIQPAFERAHGFYDGLAAVRMNQKWGYIDFTGGYVIHPVFDDARSFRQHLAAVKVDRMWGFITRVGGFAISPQYDQVDDFRGGCAWVKLPGSRDRFKIDVNGAIVDH